MIDLQQVRKRYNTFQLAIDKLTIHTGVTLLIGKNGAGKSTLLQLLATAVKPENGMITYAGKNIGNDLAIIRSEIGYLPAEIELYREMTVRQLLHYMGELKGLAEGELKQEVRQSLTQFQLSPLADKKIHRLSEGNQRRVAIAQAFLGQPAFLFLDEPLNHLDIEVKKHVITSLSLYVANRRRAVVVSTHELNEWDGQCDDILWLDGGRVRFYGTAEEWVNTPFLHVWEGLVERRELACWLDNYPVVRTQQTGKETQHLRLLAKECPDERFIPVPVTLEDGYIFRRRQGPLSFSMKG